MSTRLTTEVVTCRIRSDELTLYVFRDPDTHYEYLEHVDLFGPLIIGRRWMAKPRTVKYFSEIYDALGGRVEA